MDTAIYSFELSLNFDNSRVYAAVATRLRDHTLGTGSTDRAEGHGVHKPGDQAGVAVKDRLISKADSVKIQKGIATMR